MQDPLEKIAEIMTWYYRPIQMIEHKYRTKVTAIGLLKSAHLNTPNYLEPYLQRLISYKELIKDHTDNMKMAEETSQMIFKKIVKDIFKKNQEAGIRQDYVAMNHIITLIYPKYNGYPEKSLGALNQQFLAKYNSDANHEKISTTILGGYLNTSEKYDYLADNIVKKCLTGVTQEEVLRRISTAVYNFFVYGIYSRREATDIYNITLKTRNTVVPMKYFTKIQSLARTIINKVGSYKSTVNFFGKRWDDVQEINKLFRKNANIVVMYY